MEWVIITGLLICRCVYRVPHCAAYRLSDQIAQAVSHLLYYEQAFVGHWQFRRILFVLNTPAFLVKILNGNARILILRNVLAWRKQ